MFLNMKNRVDLVFLSRLGQLGRTTESTQWLGVDYSLIDFFFSFLIISCFCDWFWIRVCLDVTRTVGTEWGQAATHGSHGEASWRDMHRVCLGFGFVWLWLYLIWFGCGFECGFWREKFAFIAGNYIEGCTLRLNNCNIRCMSVFNAI